MCVLQKASNGGKEYCRNVRHTTLLFVRPTQTQAQMRSRKEPPHLPQTPPHFLACTMSITREKGSSYPSSSSSFGHRYACACVVCVCMSLMCAANKRNQWTPPTTAPRQGYAYLSTQRDTHIHRHTPTYTHIQRDKDRHPSPSLSRVFTYGQEELISGPPRTVVTNTNSERKEKKRKEKCS